MLYRIFNSNEDVVAGIASTLRKTRQNKTSVTRDLIWYVIPSFIVLDFKYNVIVTVSVQVRDMQYAKLTCCGI